MLIGNGFVSYYVHYYASVSESSYDLEFNHLLRGMEGIVTERPPSEAGLNPEQAQRMLRLAQLPAFANVAKLVQQNTVSATPFVLSLPTTSVSQVSMWVSVWVDGRTLLRGWTAARRS